MRAKSEPLCQALRFLTDSVSKDSPGRLIAIRDFANAHCKHELSYNEQCCDCGLSLAARDSSI